MFFRDKSECKITHLFSIGNNKFEQAALFGEKHRNVKRDIYILLCVAAALTLATGCTPDTPGVPSFLHVDGFEVAARTTGATTQDSGFYTSKIVAAYVVAHYPGEMAVDTIGLFRMPFTVPVLHDGPVDYIEFYPAVPMSGKMNSLPYYTYYERVLFSDTALHEGDTIDFGTLTTTYDALVDYPLLFEPFEPNEANIMMDSVVEWVKHDRDGARCGEGYGKVHVDPEATHVDFAINTGNFFVVSDPSKLVYLEMDVRGDLDLEVSMTSRYQSGGNLDRLQVMVAYSTDEWQHLYINLGRTWGYFNHHPQFKLGFSALNYDGTGGDVYIDNIKLLTTSKVF